MDASLYAIKPAFQRRLEPVVAALDRRGVTPDAVTWLGLGLSASSGIAVQAGRVVPALLLAVPVLLGARMAANAVDGCLARRRGSTERGAVLNEVCDAAGDAAAYLPFTALVPGLSWLVAAVVVAGLCAEVAAIAGSAVRRRNAGPLGKADRALAFSVLAVAAWAAASPAVIATCLAVMLGLALLTVRNRMCAEEG